MKSLIFPIIVIITAVVLGGCTQTTTPQTSPTTTPQTQPTQDTSSVNPVSSGDVDQDLEEIEAAIDTLDVETDFPDLNPDDLGN